MRIKSFPLLLLIIFISCSKESSNNSNISHLRLYKNAFARTLEEPNYDDYAVKLDSLLQENPTENLEFYTNLFQVFNNTKEPVKTRINRLHDLITVPEFQLYHSFYKFSSRLLLFRLHLLDKDYLNAIFQLKLAILYLEENSPEFDDEVKTYKSTLVYLTGLHQIGFFSKEINSGIEVASVVDSNFPEINHIAAYNLSLQEFANKKYASALKLINSSLDYHNKLPEKDFHFLYSTYGFKTQILAALGQKKETKKLIDFIDTQFANHLISDENYDVFLFESLYSLAVLNLKDYYEKSTQRLFNRHSLDCNDHYNAIIYHLANAKFYEISNDHKKEKSALVQTLKNLQCPQEQVDAFYTDHKKKVLKRLISLDSIEENYKALAEWTFIYNDINTSELVSQDLFQNFTQNVLQTEVTNSNKIASFYKKNSNNLKRNLKLIIILSLLLSASLFIVFALKKESDRKTKTIADNNKKLRELNLRLNESNQNLSNFNRIIAHDIKTPINSISAFSKRILKHKKDDASSDLLEMIQIINDSSAGLNTMVNNLLEFTEASINEKRLEKVNLNALIVKIQHLLIDKNMGDIDFKLPEAFPHVLAISSLIEQVFLNLIGNAIKFKKPNNPCTLELFPFNVSHNKLTIAVRDNGIGIAKKYHSKVFEFGERIKTTNKPGSGIGLSTVKKIIDAHGGRIWVESELGEGTTFYFTLPLFKEAIDVSTATVNADITT